MGKTKYHFESTHLKKEIEQFRSYLQEKQFAKNTIRLYTNYTAYFLNWHENENVTPEETTYNDILEFIDYCRSDGKENLQINHILLAINHYYGYLSQTRIIKNPATGVRVKGITKKVPQDLLNIEELEEVYMQYKVYGQRDKRNKVILGILIYQFPRLEELRKLQTTDINLKSGKIYIPGTRQSNGRMLELKSFQIMELQEYLNEVRLKLIQGTSTNQLFISMKGNTNIKNSIQTLFRTLRKQNPEIKNQTQIRMSMISHLQKTVPLRMLQYIAGHKYISSTERYKTTNTDELYKQLELFHPLR